MLGLETILHGSQGVQILLQSRKVDLIDTMQVCLPIHCTLGTCVGDRDGDGRWFAFPRCQLTQTQHTGRL